MTQFNWSVIHFAWLPILPLIVVAVGAMGVLLAGVQIDDEDSGGLGILSITLFAYFLFWNERLFALPWHSEPWLRIVIIGPPIAAAIWTGLTQRSQRALRQET